jgi:uncharacterized membrane protein YjjP (DUF1212 family)
MILLMAVKKSKVNSKRPTKVVRPKTNRKNSKEPDSTFFLKLVMYFIFGTMWIHIAGNGWTVPLPLGFIVGMAFATHDHFQIDRKIEFAVLVVAMFMSYFITPKFILSI